MQSVEQGLQWVVIVSGFGTTVVTAMLFVRCMYVRSRLFQAIGWMMFAASLTCVATLVFSTNSVLRMGVVEREQWNTIQPILAIVLRLAIFGSLGTASVNLFVVVNGAERRDVAIRTRIVAVLSESPSSGLQHGLGYSGSVADTGGGRDQPRGHLAAG